MHDHTAAFRNASACLNRPDRLRALLRLAAYPSTPGRLAAALDVSPVEAADVVDDLVEHGLVYERAHAYHASGFGLEACAFARACPPAQDPPVAVLGAHPPVAEAAVEHS